MVEAYEEKPCKSLFVEYKKDCYASMLEPSLDLHTQRKVTNMTIQETSGLSQEEEVAFFSLDGLRSTKSPYRLNQIARVKANGVADHVSLP